MRGFFGSGILSTRVDERDFLGLSRHFVTPKQSTYVHMILSHSSSYRCYALFMWRNMEKLLGCASRLLRISQILAQSYMYCIVILCYYSHGKIPYFVNMTVESMAIAPGLPVACPGPSAGQRRWNAIAGTNNDCVRSVPSMAGPGALVFGGFPWLFPWRFPWVFPPNSQIQRPRT